MEMAKDFSKRRKTLSPQWKVRILKYVVICLFLSVVNYMTSPHYWWVLWVIAGWGLNLSVGLISWYYIENKEGDKK